MQRLGIVFLILSLPGCSGCSENLPDSAAELKEAADAAERAEAAVARLIELQEPVKKLSDDEKALRKAAVLAARRARDFAELAREEKEHADALDSWKATGYRTARKLALKGTFEALALAAEQADGEDLKMLSQGVRDSALLAADLANQFTGRKPLANGDPDWKGIAVDMHKLADATPASHSQFLALSFLLVG